MHDKFRLTVAGGLRLKTGSLSTCLLALTNHLADSPHETFYLRPTDDPWSSLEIRLTDHTPTYRAHIRGVPSEPTDTYMTTVIRNLKTLYPTEAS